MTYSFDNAEGIISIKGAAYAMYATEFRIYGTNSNPAGEDDPVETKYATFNFVESEHGQIRIVNPTPDGKYPLGKASFQLGLTQYATDSFPAITLGL